MHNTSKVPIPQKMRHLPLWRGFPITHVTMINNGEPDFRTLHAGRVLQCMKTRCCGICGDDIETTEWCAFIGGEKSMSNRVFVDPAMHRDCAYYAAQVCPFLAGTRRQYSETTKTEQLGQFELLIRMDQDRPQRLGLMLAKRYDLVIQGNQPLIVAAKRPNLIDWDIMPPSSKLTETK